jgi:hypothetical protein
MSIARTCHVCLPCDSGCANVNLGIGDCPTSTPSTRTSKRSGPQMPNGGDHVSVGSGPRQQRDPV